METRFEIVLVAFSLFLTSVLTSSCGSGFSTYWWEGSCELRDEYGNSVGEKHYRICAEKPEDEVTPYGDVADQALSHCEENFVEGDVVLCSCSIYMRGSSTKCIPEDGEFIEWYD